MLIFRKISNVAKSNERIKTEVISERKYVSAIDETLNWEPVDWGTIILGFGKNE